MHNKGLLFTSSTIKHKNFIRSTLVISQIASIEIGTCQFILEELKINKRHRFDLTNLLSASFSLYFRITMQWCFNQLTEDPRLSTSHPDLYEVRNSYEFQRIRMNFCTKIGYVTNGLYCIMLMF